jgi:hypothetical protein
MSDTILLDCPQCGRKFGIAGVTGTIHVTCPACGKQWDWPPRKGGGVSQARASWRGLLAQTKFSGVHLVLATLAGIGIGIFAGIQYEIHDTVNSETHPESLPLPPPPGTGQPPSGVAPKPLGRPSIIDEIDVTNFLNIEAEKSGP